MGSKIREGLARETKIVQLKMMNFPVSGQPPLFFFPNFSSSLPTLGLAQKSLRGIEYITEPFKRDSCEAQIQRGQRVPLQDYLVETIKVKP